MVFGSARVLLALKAVQLVLYQHDSTGPRCSSTSRYVMKGACARVLGRCDCATFIAYAQGPEVLKQISRPPSYDVFASNPRAWLTGDRLVAAAF